MGHHARISAEIGTLADHDDAALAGLAALTIAPVGPISGFVSRNGRQIPFTLETTNMKPETYRLLPEQIIMAALLLVSFVPLIVHLVG